MNIAAMAFSEKMKYIPNALHDWFSLGSQVSYNKFKSWCDKYAVSNPDALEKAQELLISHQSWTRDCQINSTPVLFMNDLRLPPGIEFTDLKYFLIRFAPKNNN